MSKILHITEPVTTTGPHLRLRSTSAYTLRKWYPLKRRDAKKISTTACRPTRAQPEAHKHNAIQPAPCNGNSSQEERHHPLVPTQVIPLSPSRCGYRPSSPSSIRSCCCWPLFAVAACHTQTRRSLRPGLCREPHRHPSRPKAAVGPRRSRVVPGCVVKSATRLLVEEE